MSLRVKTSPSLRAAAFLGVLCAPIPICAEPPTPHAGCAEAAEAQFRGCDSAGWCRFWIEAVESSEESPYRVRPAGVLRIPDDAAVSIAVRDRLNALLANMIHQSKRIVLHDLCKLDDGTLSATVTVNGVDVASDPILLELREKRCSTR